MAKRCWAGKRVVITGATGFIGSSLFSHLTLQGAFVYGVSRKKSPTSNIVHLDITRRNEFSEFIKKTRPFVCYHLAGETLVETGQEHPYETFRTNMLLMLNVLEACRIHGVPRVIVASTVHVYTDTPVPYKEEDPPRPSRPYETSKTCADLMAQSYADSFQLPVVIPRFVNIYGPGDLHFTRIIPKTIKSVLSGKRPTMWGGNAVREYLYIDDALRAYELLASMEDAKLERNRIFNFGTSEWISVKNLMEKIITLAGSKLAIQKISDGRPDELALQQVSWAKAKRILGWEPNVSLEEGLRKTIAWYRKNIKKI